MYHFVPLRWCCQLQQHSIPVLPSLNYKCGSSLARHTHSLFNVKRVWNPSLHSNIYLNTLEPSVTVYLRASIKQQPYKLTLIGCRQLRPEAVYSASGVTAPLKSNCLILIHSIWVAVNATKSHLSQGLIGCLPIDVTGLRTGQ